MSKIDLIMKTKDANGNNHSFTIFLKMTVDEVKALLASPTIQIQSEKGFMILSNSDIAWANAQEVDNPGE